MIDGLIKRKSQNVSFQKRGERDGSANLEKCVSTENLKYYALVIGVGKIGLPVDHQQ